MPNLENPELEQFLNLTTNSWEDSYRMLIKLGQQLAKPTDEQLAQMHEIKGCENRLWFQAYPKNGDCWAFTAYSDARIMRGILVVLLNRVNNQTSSQLKLFDLNDFLRSLNINRSLTTTRLTGLQAIENYIKNSIN